jgi:hypothetical protein
MEFTTKIKADIDNLFYGIIPEENRKNIDIYFNEKNVTVKWRLEIEAREYGVKSIILIVQNVSGNIDWEIESNEMGQEELAMLQDKKIGGIINGNEFIEGHLFFSVINGHEGWKIISKDFTVKSDFIQPEEVVVDFKAKTITISN